MDWKNVGQILSFLKETMLNNNAEFSQNFSLLGQTKNLSSDMSILWFKFVSSKFITPKLQLYFFLVKSISLVLIKPRKKTHSMHEVNSIISIDNLIIQGWTINFICTTWRKIEAECWFCEPAKFFSQIES